MIKSKLAFKVLTEKFKVTFKRSPLTLNQNLVVHVTQRPYIVFLLTTPSLMPVSQTECNF